MARGTNENTNGPYVIFPKGTDLSSMIAAYNELNEGQCCLLVPREVFTKRCTALYPRLKALYRASFLETDFPKSATSSPIRVSCIEAKQVLQNFIIYKIAFI